MQILILTSMVIGFAVITFITAALAKALMSKLGDYIEKKISEDKC